MMNQSVESRRCPYCLEQAFPGLAAGRRRFFHCSSCRLVFRDGLDAPLQLVVRPERIRWVERADQADNAFAATIGSVHTVPAEVLTAALQQPVTHEFIDPDGSHRRGSPTS